MRRRPVPTPILCGISVVLCASAAAAQSGAWSARGPDGGNVYCVAAAPGHPATLYAGTADGVYRSDDGGAAWRPANAGIPAERVQSIAIEPSSPNTLYAGTITPTGVASVGIFKSVDGGQSWTAANTGLTDPISGIAPLDVEALAVDPANPGVVLAGTRFSDIFRSADGGATWTPVTLGGFNVGLEVSAFLFDASTPGAVLAASTSGLLRSVDDGQSWDFYGDAGVTFFSLAADPTTPATIYAGNVNGFGALKSTNGGAHWTQINAGLPTAAGSSGTAWPSVLSIVVDPVNSSTLTIGTFGDGVFTSADGGTTWTASSSGLRSAFVGSLRFGGASGTLLAGTFGAGVFRRSGAADWAPSSAGIPLSRVASLARDPSRPSTLFAGAFDGVHRSDDGGESWGPSVGNLPVFPVASVAAITGNGGRLLAGTLGGGLLQSADAGATWAPAGTGLTDAFVGSVAVDPSNPQVLYAATGDPAGTTSPAVFRSADGGATWTKTSLAAGSGTVSIDFVTVNPSNSSEVAAVSRGEAIYFHSADSGSTWSQVTPSSACGTVRTALFDGTAVLLGGASGVCRSTDGGSTWNASTVATEASVETLAADPSDPNVIYAGAAPAATGGTGGVFRSVDGGATWQPIGQGLEAAAVTSVLVDPGTGALHAGTDGGGVAVLSFETPDRLPIATAPAGSRGTRILGPR